MRASYICSEANQRPSPGRRVAASVSPVVMVGAASAAIVAVSGRVGEFGEITFTVPVPLAGATQPETTVWESSLEIEIARDDMGTSLLPVVYEPNGGYLGSMSAPVTMVEYGDYQCPYCRAFFAQTWPQLKSEYVDTGKVRFLFQDMAFLGPDSTTAAEAAHCAGDQYRFWEYHDYLYAHQGAENSGWAAAGPQKTFAASLGLDTAQFDNCLDSGKYAQEVAGETATGHKNNINATPGFLINGTVFIGAQPTTAFEQVIDAALSGAGVTGSSSSSAENSKGSSAAGLAALP